nr:putative ribonuclease H-like domain-containing protein [Tanacetum cinerariifolium]
FISDIYEEKTHKDLHTCLFACFLSQEEPKRITNALKDPAWVEAMQKELLQFHLQNVWTLVDLPRGKRAIDTKWVFRNKKDERGIAIRNKARLVAQGCTQEEGIDYDEVFAPVARIEAIRMFLAYASFMGFLVYQLDVKSDFLYGRIEEEVYVCQPSGFEDPDYYDKAYKVEKALYGLHQAPRAWLQVKQKSDGIFISQDKYVDEILRKFKYEDVKTASTPMDKEKALLKDSDGDDVDVHLYMFMIGSLMYLTSSRPYIMFSYKKQIVVATSTTKAEYVAAASCCGQVLWIQNQLLDCGLTFAGDAHHIWLSLILDKKMIKYELSNGLTLDNREIKLNATVNSQVKTITEAYVRRHLKLADADGISTLPTTEFFEQLALIGKTRTKIGRMGIRIPQSNVSSSVVDEAITKEMHNGLGRATTTASSLAAEQGSGNISKTQTKATPFRPSSPRTSSKGGPGCHFTMGDSSVQARPERLSNLPERAFEILVSL